MNKKLIIKISDHALYCDKYEDEYYVNGYYAKIPLRWMSWEAVLMVSVFQKESYTFFSRSKLTFIYVFRVRRTQQRTRGLTPLRPGRCSATAPRCHSRSWPRSRCSRTAAGGTRAELTTTTLSHPGYCRSRVCALARSIESWASAGAEDPRIVRASRRFISFLRDSRPMISRRGRGLPEFDTSRVHFMITCGL